MEQLRSILLLVSVAALIPTQAVPQSSLSYPKALSTAIHFYNQIHGRENAFRLLKTYPPSPSQESDEQVPKLLSFTLKETICPVTEELLLDQCDFKADGLVKECQGSVSNEQDTAAIILTCEPVAPVPSRSRRTPLPRRKNGSKNNRYRTGGYSLISMKHPTVAWSSRLENLYKTFFLGRKNNVLVLKLACVRSGVGGAALKKRDIIPFLP
ncbi:cathelin-related peptide SC5-like [Gracilinanus agilis]|uniref:cathelin-related peptide SC5-like n=1 Tax=Gracilinanus agilis TaxID=191870 RepID=UPI001CFE08F5|nr:cathelin-related peptide SC5-like [Gracilinanus agilis]